MCVCISCFLYMYHIGSVSLENPDENNISDFKAGVWTGQVPLTQLTIQVQINNIHIFDNFFLTFGANHCLSSISNS